MITYAEARSRINTRNEAERAVLSDAYHIASIRQVKSGPEPSPKMRRQVMRDEFREVLNSVWSDHKPVGNPVAVWLFWLVVRSIVWQVVLLMWGELGKDNAN